MINDPLFAQLLVLPIAVLNPLCPGLQIKHICPGGGPYGPPLLKKNWDLFSDFLHSKPIKLEVKGYHTKFQDKILKFGEMAAI